MLGCAVTCSGQCSLDFVSKVDFDRLNSCVSYLAPPDDQAFLRIVHELYAQRSRFPEALAVALRLADRDLVLRDFQAAGDP